MFLTVLGTVLSGVFVFILGQLFIEYILHPIQEFKLLKSEIAYMLVYYENIYTCPVTESHNQNFHDMHKEASAELRKYAAKCVAFGEKRPSKAIFIPSKNVFGDVSSCLILISNNSNENSDIYEQIRKIEENRDRIKQLLGIG